MNSAVTIIADLVDSRSIDNREIFQRRLKEILKTLSKDRREHLWSPYTLTLGDEFQAVYKDFGFILADILTILEAIHPQKLRVALGIGFLTTDINTDEALGMDGPAFASARDLLESMKKTPKTLIQIIDSEKERSPLINSTLRLLSNNLSDWKKTTLSIACALNAGRSTEDIARELGMTSRGVNRNISGNAVKDVLRAMAALEEDMKTG